MWNRYFNDIWGQENLESERRGQISVYFVKLQEDRLCCAEDQRILFVYITYMGDIL